MRGGILWQGTKARLLFKGGTCSRCEAMARPAGSCSPTLCPRHLNPCAAEGRSRCLAYLAYPCHRSRLLRLSIHPSCCANHSGGTGSLIGRASNIVPICHDCSLHHDSIRASGPCRSTACSRVDKGISVSLVVDGEREEERGGVWDGGREAIIPDCSAYPPVRPAAQFTDEEIESYRDVPLISYHSYMP